MDLTLHVWRQKSRDTDGGFVDYKATGISPDASLAWEMDYTMLCRMRREPQNHPNPYLLGSFAVLETRF